MNAAAKRDRVPIAQSSRFDEAFSVVVIAIAGAMGCMFAGLGLWGLFGMYRFVMVTELSWGIVEVAGLVFVATFFTACVAVPVIIAAKFHRGRR